KKTKSLASFQLPTFYHHASALRIFQYDKTISNPGPQRDKPKRVHHPRKMCWPRYSGTDAVVQPLNNYPTTSFILVRIAILNNRGFYAATGLIRTKHGIRHS